jgi:hypothetical protein
MCMGGGGVQGAKINKHAPERKKASKQLNKVVKAINRITGDELMKEGVKADDTPLLAAQQLLHSSNAMLSGTLDRATQLQTAAANSQAMLSQNALQMAALVGPPPPEKSAEKVVVGKARGVETESDRNRRSLRIDLNTGT